MVEPDAGRESYPLNTDETVSGYPYRMSKQDSRVRIDALQAGLNSLIYANALEADETQLANQRAFVQTLSACSTLLVRELAGYDDVIIPPGPNIAQHVRALQGLYGEIPELRVLPNPIDTSRDISREELARAMRGCYEVQTHTYRASDEIQQRMANATLGLWDDIVRANPDGILMDQQADGWMQQMEDRRREAFGPGQ